MEDPQRYRYNHEKEFTQRLKNLAEQYHNKIATLRQKKMAIVDTILYFLPVSLASISIILTSASPIPPAIIISISTTVTAVTIKMSKMLLSCYHQQIKNNIAHHTIAMESYSKIISLISSSVENSDISEEEFSEIDKLNDKTMIELENESETPPANNDNNDPPT